MRKLYVISILTLIYFNASSQNIDIDILKKINQNRIKNSDPAFLLITNSASPISVATPFIITATGYLSKDSITFQKGLFIAETFLVSAAISTAMKYAINRPRPFESYPYEIEKLASAGSPSFPSGHTSEAFSTATSLSLAFPKWYVITPAFLWASAVGYSRMDLGVHYPSDVIMGAVVGSGSAFLTDYINNKLIKNIQRKKLQNKNDLLLKLQANY